MKKVKAIKTTSTQVLNTPKVRDYSYASLENSENENKTNNNKYVPQNTRNRTYLRTTRNTIAQHAPKQIAIPEPFSASSRYSNNINTSKASESNATIIYDLKKPNRAKYGKNFTKTMSNTRPTSNHKPY